MKTKTLLNAILTFAIILNAFDSFAQCTAGFTNTISGSTVTFTNTCSGAITPFYNWNFGDGNFSNAANPTNVYTYNGTYNVCLQYRGDTLVQPGCLSTFCDTVIITNAQNTSWTQKANFGGAGRYFATGFSIGTKAYVGTGTSQAGQTNDFWEYNPTTNTWTQIANFAGGNTTQGVGFSVGLKGYMIPGSSKNLWEYNPATNLWTQKTSFGGPGQYNASSFTIGNKAYVGAIGSNYNSPEFWEYDPSTDTWTQKANYGGGIATYAVGFSIGPKGYIGTGQDSAFGGTQFFEYDPSTNTWTQKADFAGGARQYAAGFSIGGKGYIGTGNNNLQDFWQYNPATDTWIQMGNIPNGGTTTATGFSIGNKGYIVCGQDVTGYSRALWEFDPQDTASNLLHGKVFTDANANCIVDGSDISLVNWFAEAINSAADVYYGSSNVNGDYNIWVPSGTYTVSLIPKTYWAQVCPASTYTASVTTQDTVSSLNFGADISVYCPDLAVSIGSANMRRCLKNNFYVQYWNNGTTTATNALLKVNFDYRIIPLSSTVPWDSISGNSYFWKVPSVQPGQYVSFTVLDSISCNAQLGDTLYTSAQWLNVTGDFNGENNVDYDHHVVIGSYDPNAKEAFTSTNKAYIKQANILPTDTINYMIQFQNTGTDTAFTVAVYDTLDSDLNIPSVISGVSSHPYSFELLGTGILKWTFNNILLPDSNINEMASHGFVKFQILQKPNNPNGTVIKNSAGIVFDFNVPVITDTVVLTVGTPTGMGDGKGEENSIIIYPNPSSGTLTLLFESATTATLNVMNVLGEVVYSEQIKNTLRKQVDLNNMSNGIYFIQLKTKETSLIKKLVIDK